MTQRKETRDQSFFKLSLRSFYGIEQGEEIKRTKPNIIILPLKCDLNYSVKT